MEQEIEVVAEKKPFKEILKEQAFNIGIGVATFALAAWGAYDNHKRNNRKEERYYDYLDSKLELLEESTGAYRDSLTDSRPDSQKEDGE